MLHSLYHTQILSSSGTSQLATEVGAVLPLTWLGLGRICQPVSAFEDTAPAIIGQNWGFLTQEQLYFQIPGLRRD